MIIVLAMLGELSGPAPAERECFASLPRKRQAEGEAVNVVEGLGHVGEYGLHTQYFGGRIKGHLHPQFHTGHRVSGRAHQRVGVGLVDRRNRYGAGEARCPRRSVGAATGQSRSTGETGTVFGHERQWRHHIEGTTRHGVPEQRGDGVAVRCAGQ